MGAQQFSYVFSVRPSTSCNLHCSYCYRADELVADLAQRPFDVDAMVWHALQRPGSLFNFCGYGETMLHPQFHEMIIALSQVTYVNWVTNGTVFRGKGFDAILARARHHHIHSVVISLHFEQLAKRIDTFARDVRYAVQALSERRVQTHLTTIVTDDNIDAVIALKDRIGLPIGYKTTFPQFFQAGETRTWGYSARTTRLLEDHGIEPDQDFRHDPLPFLGKPCPNGARVFEVMHDGEIYDCAYDPARASIGNINVLSPIRALRAPRLCRVACPECIPMVRDGFSLLHHPTPPRASLWDLLA